MSRALAYVSSRCCYILRMHKQGTVTSWGCISKVRVRVQISIRVPTRVQISIRVQILSRDMINSYKKAKVIHRQKPNLWITSQKAWVIHRQMALIENYSQEPVDNFILGLSIGIFSGPISQKHLCTILVHEIRPVFHVNVLFQYIDMLSKHCAMRREHYSVRIASKSPRAQKRHFQAKSADRTNLFSYLTSCFL